ncbi:MAG: hypothetical protein ABFS18_06210 [Thermodesulfobacteriota bacterium]
MPEITRNKAIEATHILNDLIGDFVVAVVTLKDYQKRLGGKAEWANGLVAANKMCLSFIVLGFDKWIEFFGHYHRLFDGELHANCKTLTKTFRNRGVTKFRNKCIGHVLDNKTKKPLFPSDVNQSLQKIIGEDLGAFLNWVHNIDGDQYPETVASIVEEARNYLAEEYDIPHKEIMSK